MYWCTGVALFVDLGFVLLLCLCVVDFYTRHSLFDSHNKVMKRFYSTCNVNIKNQKSYSIFFVNLLFLKIIKLAIVYYYMH